MHAATPIDDIVNRRSHAPALPATANASESSKPDADLVLAADLARLSSTILAKRLVEYAGEERLIIAAFLQHLDAFDRQRGYLEAGHGSLWDYCIRVLHLGEGAAGRRIAAMRVVRRFPKIVHAIRDGRLCLSTVSLLSSVLTEQNFEDLVARAAFKTKAEVEHLVASERPRRAPPDGVRRLAAGQPCEVPVATRTLTTPRHALTRDSGDARTEPTLLNHDVLSSSPGRGSESSTTASTVTAPAGTAAAVTAVAQAPLGAPNASAGSGTGAITPVASDSWSVRFTVDGEGKAELDLLQALLSHKCGRNLASVMREAIRCAIDKHGKRRGVVPPRRARQTPARERAAGSTPSGGVAAPHTGVYRSSAPPEARDPPGTSVPPDTSVSRQASVPPRRGTIPADVRQAVYERDGGSCSYVSPDGQRCGSRWKLEFDHILPAFLDGPPTTENVRLVCRAHNVHHAEQVFGREHMERFRKRYSVEGVG